MVACCTPWDRSFTNSLLGQRVAAMRRRRSSRASSGMSTWKGRISLALSTVLMTTSVVGGGADRRSDRNGRKPEGAAGDRRRGWQPPLCHRTLHAVGDLLEVVDQRIAGAVVLGGVVGLLGVRHDRAPFAQPAPWRPACAQPRCAVHPHRVIGAVSARKMAGETTGGSAGKQS